MNTDKTVLDKQTLAAEIKKVKKQGTLVAQLTRPVLLCSSLKIPLSSVVFSKCPALMDHLWIWSGIAAFI